MMASASHRSSAGFNAKFVWQHHMMYAAATCVMASSLHVWWLDRMQSTGACG